MKHHQRRKTCQPILPTPLPNSVQKPDQESGQTRADSSTWSGETSRAGGNTRVIVHGHLAPHSSSPGHWVHVDAYGRKQPGGKRRDTEVDARVEELSHLLSSTSTVYNPPALRIQAIQHNVQLLKALTQHVKGPNREETFR